MGPYLPDGSAVSGSGGALRGVRRIRYGVLRGRPGHARRGLTEIRALTSAGSFSLLGEQGGRRLRWNPSFSGIPELDAAEPGQDAVLAVSLTEITDRAAFCDLVTRPVAARIPARQEEPEGCLTLVLDGLDQC